MLPTPLMRRYGLTHPLLQAPMAGVSTPAQVAAVCRAGGLGGLPVGALSAEAAAQAIAQTQSLTDRPFVVNVFAHAPAPADPDREQAWLSALAPAFAAAKAQPPARLNPGYRSILEDPERLQAIIDAAPAILSTHFGLLAPDQMAQVKAAGIAVWGCATSVAEAKACEAAGCEVIIAQGWEAGGHRGCFSDVPAEDPQIGTLALVPQIVDAVSVPVIAAGGIADGRGVVAALALGAQAAQLGTAFINTTEAATGAAYRALLTAEHAEHGPCTLVTPAISGRPARGIPGPMVRGLDSLAKTHALPAYPIPYTAAKALAAAAAAAGSQDVLAAWCGQHHRHRGPLSAADVVTEIAAELAGLRRRLGEGDAPALA